jgi:cytochrome P450
VKKGLNDDRLSAKHTVHHQGVQRNVDLGLFAKIPTLPSTDPPQHTRLRKLVNRAFTPTSIEQLRAFIETIVDEQLQVARERGSLDLFEDLAGPLPALVIAKTLGFPAEDAQLLRKWSDDLLVAFEGYRATSEQLDAASTAAREFEEYLRRDIRSRPSGDGDLLVRLRDVSMDGDSLSEEEVITTCMLLLIAGHETTTGLITNGTYALIEQPDAFAALSQNKALVPSAVEEFLRFYGPVQMALRTATEDFQLAGGTVAKGDGVALLLGAANRDPRQFEEPDRVKVDRLPNEHLAFGHFRHFCLGAHLARLEAQIAFAKLLDELPSLDLVDDAPPKWAGSLQSRRMQQLFLALSS